MPQKQRRPAATNSQAPRYEQILTPTITLQRAYLQQLSAACRLAAASNDAGVIVAMLQLLERVSSDIRRMRRADGFHH
jgi:hypothetical protein